MENDASISSTNLARAAIREVACPTCSAKPGEFCVYSGKGSLKAMRLGRNHHERMHLAQKMWQGIKLEVIE